MRIIIKRSLRRFMLIYHRYFGKKTVYAKLMIQPFVDRGLRIGKNVAILDSYIDPLYPYLIKVGDNVTITSSALITHDASMKKVLGKSLIGRINIGNNVFIGYNSIVLPDTNIGNNVVIGAGSIISKHIPDNSIVIGKSKIISTYDEYIEKMKILMNKRPVYNFDANKNSSVNIDKIIDDLESGVGFND